MSTIIIASGIPSFVTDSKIEEFFSFCGKIKSIKQIDSNNDSNKTKEIQVEFYNSSAVSTALLLNGAELEGGVVSVKSLNDSDTKEISNTDTAKSDLQDSTLSSSTSSSAAPGTSPSPPLTDIAQEHKPKSTILAEYLAQGYVLSDNLIDKAVKFDQKNGISKNFTNFLTGLDKKYHIQEKNQEINTQANSTFTDLYNKANTNFNLENRLNNSRSTLDSYYDKFKHDKIGSKIHQFYTDVATDAKQVHEEAKRLADAKKQQQLQGGETSTLFVNSIAPNSSTLEAASAVSIEKNDEKNDEKN